MTTMLDRPEVGTAAGRQSWWRMPELWGAISIASMWLAVLFVGIYGGDLTSWNAGSQSTTIPSAVFVAFFAFLATVSVAKRAFARGGDATR